MVGAGSQLFIEVNLRPNRVACLLTAQKRYEDISHVTDESDEDHGNDPSGPDVGGFRVEDSLGH